MNNIFIEKSLKRYIKTKKIGYTVSLFVGFLITGNIIYAETAALTRSEIEARIKENNKRIEEIERRTVELLKEGDYYAKTLEDNKQFFFPLNHEHRHASKGNEGTEIILGMEIVPPGKPGGPTEIIPGMPLNPSVTRPEKPDVIKPEILTPVLPELPEKSEVNSELEHIDIENIEEPQITPSTPDINTDIVTPHIGKIEIDDSMEQGVGKIDIDKYIDISGNADTNINITEAGFNLKRPDVSYVYVPKEPISPEKFTIDKITAPSEIHLPEIEVNTTSFEQGIGGMFGNKSTVEAFSENYGNYKTTGDGVEVNFDDEVENGKVKNKLSYNNSLKNLEIYVVEEDQIKNKNNLIYAGEKVDLNKVHQQNENRPRTEYYRKDENNVPVATFISTTMAKDSVVNGKYTLNYGNAIANNTRIFLSVNNAGILWSDDSSGSYNYIGGIENGGESLKDDCDKDKKMEILTEFTGELNLKNNILENKKVYGTLVGVDHQLWDMMKSGNYSSTEEYRQSYSIFKNSGIINLGKEDGRDRNLIGMSIETEHDNVTIDKTHNHVTINKGVINLNGQNSIGIGFENGGKVADGAVAFFNSSYKKC
ncbi:MAG: hypothetical protein ACLT40_05070 [Fusobacterium sp.]